MQGRDKGLLGLKDPHTSQLGGCRVPIGRAPVGEQAHPHGRGVDDPDASLRCQGYQFVQAVVAG